MLFSAVELLRGARRGHTGEPKANIVNLCLASKQTEGIRTNTILMCIFGSFLSIKELIRVKEEMEAK